MDQKCEFQRRQLQATMQCYDVKSLKDKHRLNVVALKKHDASPQRIDAAPNFAIKGNPRPRVLFSQIVFSISLQTLQCCFVCFREESLGCKTQVLASEGQSHAWLILYCKKSFSLCYSRLYKHSRGVLGLSKND